MKIPMKRVRKRKRHVQSVTKRRRGGQTDKETERKRKSKRQTLK